MQFKDLQNRWEHLRQVPLPGAEIQYRMAPMRRKPVLAAEQIRARARQSAVVAVIENVDEEAHLLVIKRSHYRGVHSGQISLPGGKREAADRSFLDTALRELREEVGIAEHLPKVLRPLTELYIPPSNFWVQPYIALLEDRVDLSPQEREVSGIFHLPLSGLLHPESRQNSRVKVSNGSYQAVPSFQYGGLTIWGATAMIINELLWLLETSEQK